MPPRFTSFLAYAGAVGIIIGTILVLTQTKWGGVESPVTGNGKVVEAPINASTSTAASQSAAVASSDISPATSSPKKTSSSVKTAPVKQPEQSTPPPSSPPANATTPPADASDGFQAFRIENPYPFPPQIFEVTNNEAREALVNILCAARSGSLRPISASGIIIDGKGVILTNAHVAQYVLLSSDPQVDLSCTIRTGSPAVARFIPEVLYIPPVWVKEHASDIKTARPTGTGEHDYALLRINGTIDGSPLPFSFPSLPFDAREGIGFPDDSVLVASYPAEFIGGMTAQLNLHPVTSVTRIMSLLTFGTIEGTVDLVSVGGVIGAQSGSSGGAVVNAWGRLIGLISTTSEGETTAERDLRAITMSYINRDISAQSGQDLAGILAGDVAEEARAWNADEAPALIKLLIDQLKSR
ncbi:MAG: serine protease [bacterium]|nr:serine protease [bacterium]